MKIDKLREVDAATILAGAKETLQGFVDQMTALGLVVTISQKSLMPPAMGVYESVVEIRFARHVEIVK